MRLAAVSLALVICGAAFPAAATEWVRCTDATNTAGIDLLFGQADTIYLDSFILSADDKIWASNTAVGPGDPITAAQWFGDADSFDGDFIDGDGVKLAEVRIRYASEGDMQAAGGTLRIVGHGAWTISCSGDE